MEGIVEYLKSLLQSLSELAESSINKIKEVSENIKQRRKNNSFQNSAYNNEPQKSFYGSIKDGLNSIGENYREIRSGIAPIGYLLLATIPFIFLYQYSIVHIRINEKLIIFLVVVIAALLNILSTGLAFSPVAALMFFSMWENNIIIAGFNVLLLLIVSAEASDKKRGKYLFPIAIMILTGCSSDTGVYLSLALMFVCSLLWPDSMFTILAPMFVLINTITIGQVLNVITLNGIDRVNLFNISISDYVPVVYKTTVSFEKSFQNIVSLFKINYPIYISLFFGLYIVAKIFKFIVKLSRIDRSKFKYIIISHLYCSVTFWLVLRITNFVYSTNSVIATLKLLGQDMKLLYSFDNLFSILPMIIEHIKNNNFIYITISDIVIAFLLSIPISLFVNGYDANR